MTFAGRSEHAETACRVAPGSSRLCASHRPRRQRCQALVLAGPEGRITV
jgi:hypothetical protein